MRHNELERLCSPSTVGGDEVEAAVDSMILDRLPIKSRLILQVLFELILNVFVHRFPAGDIQEHVKVFCKRKNMNGDAEK